MGVFTGNWSGTAVCRGVFTGNWSDTAVCVWVCLQVTTVRYSCVCMGVFTGNGAGTAVCMVVLTGNSQIQLCVYGCVYR